MEIRESIGSFDVACSGSVLIFRDEPVILTLSGLGKEIQFESHFITDASKEIKLNQRVEGDTMILEFYNIPDGSFGLPVPVDVAKSDDGKDLIYFNCYVTTFSAEKGSRMLSYAFYKKK